jgi:hypothetical protein
MGWAFEERDTMEPPCACEPLGGVWSLKCVDGQEILDLGR